MPVFPYKGMTKQYTLHIWERAIVHVRHEKCWIQNCRKSISSNTYSNNAMYSFAFSTYWHCYFFFQNPKTDSPTPLELNPWQGAPKTKNPCPLGLEERVLSCLGTHIREGRFLERYCRCGRSCKSLRVPPIPPHTGSLVQGRTGLFSISRMAELSFNLDHCTVACSTTLLCSLNLGELFENGGSQIPPMRESQRRDSRSLGFLKCLGSVEELPLPFSSFLVNHFMIEIALSIE